MRSVQAQTVACSLVVIEDADSKGAGWARNRGLEQVKTPFVAFLDADDELDPRFAEITLGILEQYAQAHVVPRYAYTDWYGVDNAVFQAPEPCVAWTEKTYHLVTTVIPTDRARLIGGFDEMLGGVEDADFYLRLRLSGVCGLHINAPLMSYREGGQRSVQARQNGDEAQAQAYISSRYGGYNLMGCCGDDTQGSLEPTTEPSPGDVLVQAQWGGNMVKRGVVTGRLYPRTSSPRLLYVNEADAAMMPHLFKRITSPAQVQNGVVLQPQYQADSNWQAVVNTVFGGAAIPQQPSKPVEYKPNVTGRSKKATIEAAQEWVKVEGNLE